MLLDRVDKLHILALGAALAVGVLLLITPGPADQGRDGEKLTRALQRRMAAEAQQVFLRQSYAPVIELQQAGELPQALLKLKELERDLPGEPHGEVLRGEIQFQSGALGEAITSLVRGVKGRGDYVDERSPLSRRRLISALVDKGMADLLPKARSHADNISLQQQVRGLYYLQSRLAGGCE